MPLKLPLACEVTFHEHFVNDTEATLLFNSIVNLMDTNNHQMQLENGEIFQMNIGKCLFLDKSLWKLPCFLEVHGDKFKWPKLLLNYKEKIEKITNKKFDIGSVSYYEDGTRNITYHVDYPYFGPIDYIPSLSLGATRTFGLKSIQNEDDELHISLKHGDLLIMGPHCQHTYQHAILQDKTVEAPRINITFWQLNNFLPKY